MSQNEKRKWSRDKPRHEEEDACRSWDESLVNFRTSWRSRGRHDTKKDVYVCMSECVRTEQCKRVEHGTTTNPFLCLYLVSLAHLASASNTMTWCSYSLASLSLSPANCFLFFFFPLPKWKLRALPSTDKCFSSNM